MEVLFKTGLSLLILAVIFVPLEWADGCAYLTLPSHKKGEHCLDKQPVTRGDVDLPSAQAEGEKAAAEGAMQSTEKSRKAISASVAKQREIIKKNHGIIEGQLLGSADKL